MNKLTTIIAAFAFAGAAFAQTSANDSIAAAKANLAAAKQAAKEQAAAEKQAAKELKAKNAADLKAFKEKQKSDLAAFIAKQNGEKKALVQPTLKDAADSVAYIFGVSQARGLKPYMSQQLGVDTLYMDDFTDAILDGVGIDLTNPSNKAKSAGQQIATQIISMSESFSKDYYAADPDKKMDTNIIANGIVAGLTGQSYVGPDEAGQQFQTIITARQAANKERLYGANREAGEKFLAENKTKPGVITTASGLQYKVITEGTGDTPKATDKVKVNYEGKLIDGTVFDSSYKRNKPTSFNANQVIKGWTEALQLMKEGAKYELYIPYELAYGDRETGKEIKPYSALIFTVELLEIENKKPAATQEKADEKLITGKTTKKK